MKSKVEKAKSEQGWVRKFEATCSFCRHFYSEIHRDQWGTETEKNMRCSLGGFKTWKMSTCKEFDRRE